MEREEFHGRWTIHVADLWVSWGTRLVFSGSAASDGAHELTGLTSYEVDGVAWTVAVETKSWDFEDNWTAQPLNRRGRFDGAAGLTFDVEMGTPHPGGVVPEWDYVHLKCVCADQTVNPLPLPNPFDFTYPGH